MRFFTLYLVCLFVSVFFIFYLDVRIEEDGVKKTSERGLSKFLSLIFRRSTAPEQVTDDIEVKQIWIRSEADADGYFLLQFAKRFDHSGMCLTAEDDSSLTIQRK